MATGWFVVQPPSSGTLRNNRKPVSVQMAAAQLTDGSIAPIVLDKIAVAMAGQHPLHGPMNIELDKLIFSMNGEEKTFGGIAVRLPKVSTTFEQELISGGLFSTLKPIKLAAALQTEGGIAMTTARVAMSMASMQEYTGTLGAQLRAAQAIIAGAYQQDGTATVGLKKTTTAATGEVPVPQVISTAYAAGDTVATPAHQTGDMIIAFVSRTGSAAPALLSGWTQIATGNRAVGTGNYSARISYKIAASSSETIGTWTTTEQLIVLVVRNVASLGAVASQGIGGGSSNKTVTYPAITLQGTNGKSRVLRFARGGGASSLLSDLLTNPISGYTLKEGNNLIVALESPLTSTNPVAQTQVTADTSYWWTATVELRGN